MTEHEEHAGEHDNATVPIGAVAALAREMSRLRTDRDPVDAIAVTAIIYDAGYRIVPGDSVEALKPILTQAMSNESEEQYCASWLSGWEHRVWLKIDDYPGIKALRDMIGEWPVYNSDPATWEAQEFHWVTLDEFAEQHRTWFAEWSATPGEKTDTGGTA